MRRGVPDEVAADRSAHLDAIAGHDDLVEGRRDLAAIDELDREVNLALALRLRRDRVASLRAIAVLGGEADVVVLAGAVPPPPRQREREALDARRLGRDALHHGDLPLERGARGCR